MRVKKYLCISCRAFKITADFEHKEDNLHRSRKCMACVGIPVPKNLLKGQARVDADNETELFNRLNGAW